MTLLQTLQIPARPSRIKVNGVQQPTPQDTGYIVHDPSLYEDYEYFLIYERADRLSFSNRPGDDPETIWVIYCIERVPVDEINPLGYDLYHLLGSTCPAPFNYRVVSYFKNSFSKSENCLHIYDSENDDALDLMLAGLSRYTRVDDPLEIWIRENPGVISRVINMYEYARSIVDED